MMKNCDESVEIYHNPNWPYVPHCPYKVLVIGGSGSGKTNVLLNLINDQPPDIDKITYMSKIHLNQSISCLLMKKKKVGIEKQKVPKQLIDYSLTVNDDYENLEGCNRTEKRIVLIVFDDIIEDMESNKELTPIVIEFFFRRRKLNIGLAFISQSSFKVPEAVKLNATHYFTKKVPKKGELQQIASNHLSEIDFKDFMKLCKHCIKQLHSISLNGKTLPLDHPSRFWKILL